MTRNNIDLLKETIETYPKYRHEFIYKLLCNQVKFTEENNSLFESDKTFVKISKEMTDLEKILETIDQLEHGCREVTKTDFFHSYKYATIVENTISEDKVINFFRNDENYVNASSSFDNICNEITSSYVPSYLKLEDNVHVLKFSRKLTGYLPREINHKTNFIYNVLLIYFEKLNVFEIRYDSVQTHYKFTYGNIYSDTRDLILDWVNSNIGITTTPINLSSTVDYLRQSDESIAVRAQEMHLKTGSFVTLDVGINENVILPLIGELEEILILNEELFTSNKQTTKINDILKDFIKEKEETSNLPWVTLIWNHDKKANAVEIKFSFNHNKGIYDVLLYYGNNAKAGRMNDVTRILIESRKKLESINHKQSREANKIT